MRFPTMWYVATNKASDQPAHTCSLIRAFDKSLDYSMSVKLLIEHQLEFLSLKGGSTGSSESTLFKMPNCWKSYVGAHSVLIAIPCADPEGSDFDNVFVLVDEGRDDPKCNYKRTIIGVSLAF